MNPNTRFPGKEGTEEKESRKKASTSNYSLLLTNEETRLPEVSQQLRRAAAAALGRCTETERRQLRALMAEGCTEAQLLHALSEAAFAPRPSMRYAAAVARRMMAQGIRDGAEDRRRWSESWAAAAEAHAAAGAIAEGAAVPARQRRKLNADYQDQRVYQSGTIVPEWLRDEVAAMRAAGELPPET